MKLVAVLPKRWRRKKTWANFKPEYPDTLMVAAQASSESRSTQTERT